MKGRTDDRARQLLRERRKDYASYISSDIDWAEKKLRELREALENMKRFPSHNTGENRSFYLEKFVEARKALETAQVRWQILCELYEVIGDTKERAW